MPTHPLLAALAVPNKEEVKRTLTQLLKGENDQAWKQLRRGTSVSKDGQIICSPGREVYWRVYEPMQDTIALWALRKTGKLDKLRTLILSKLTIESLDFLANLPHLSRLDIADCQDLNDISALSTLRPPLTLHARGCKLKVLEDARRMHTNGDILEFTAENNEPKLSPGNLTEFGHLSEAINARIDSTTGAKLKLEAYLETKTTNFVGITREGLDYCLSNYPDPTAEATDKSAREILISSAFLYEGEVAHAYEIDVDVDHEHLSKIAAMRCDSDLLDFFLDSYPQIDSCGGDEGGSLLRWYLPGLNASIEMENGSPKLFCINTRANKLPEARLALSYTIELARLIKNERKSFVSQHDNAKQIYGQLQDAHTTLESSTDTKTKSSFDQILNACRDTRTDLEAFFYSLAEKLVAIETAIYFLTFLTAEHGVPSPAGMNYDDTGWHWKENAITECQLKLQKKEPIGEAEKYTYSNIQIEFRNE